MKNLCLENYGVSKLETQEMRATNGGWFLVALAAAFLIGLISGLVDQDDSCIE